MTDTHPGRSRPAALRACLLEAVTQGAASEVRALLGRGAPPEAAITPPPAQTALHVAAKLGHTPCIDVLLEAGADVNSRCGAGRTALSFAAAHDHLEATRRLISRGAELEIPAAAGRRALHHAALTGACECLRALCAAGAEVNSRDGSGNTPLHLACEEGHPDAVQVLLEAGADPDLRAYDGLAPAGVAQIYDKTQALAVLTTWRRQERLRTAVPSASAPEVGAEPGL